MPDASSQEFSEIGRAEWMGLFAQANREELESAWTALAPQPSYTLLRKPEAGLVMVRGRAGGTGAAFNLGEMTMTRCAVRLDQGARPIGLSFIAGRDGRRAELAALFDAVLQGSSHHRRIACMLLATIDHRLAETRHQHLTEAAATRVDFFTMVREQGSE